MKVTRLYTGDDGQSHFEDVDIALEDHGVIGKLSERIAATGVIFRENAANYDYQRHNAPQRQYILLLSGAGPKSRSATAASDASKRVTSCWWRTRRVRDTSPTLRATNPGCPSS